jgi:hypothetical protein
MLHDGAVKYLSCRLVECLNLLVSFCVQNLISCAFCLGLGLVSPFFTDYVFIPNKPPACIVSEAHR